MHTPAPPALQRRPFDPNFPLATASFDSIPRLATRDRGGHVADAAALSCFARPAAAVLRDARKWMELIAVAADRCAMSSISLCDCCRFSKPLVHAKQSSSATTNVRMLLEQDFLLNPEILRLTPFIKQFY